MILLLLALVNERGAASDHDASLALPASDSATVCQPLLEKIKTACRLAPNENKNRAIAETIGKELSELKCDTRITEPNELNLVKSIIWESRRLLEKIDPLQDEPARFHSLIQRVGFHLSGREKVTTNKHFIDDLQTELGSFSDPNYRVLINETILLLNHEANGVSQRALNAFTHALILDPQPFLALSNVCAQVSDRHPRFSEVAKAHLGTILLALGMSQRKPVDISDRTFDVTKAIPPPKELQDLLREVAKGDSAGRTRENLVKWLVPFMEANFEPRNYGNHENYSDQYPFPKKAASHLVHELAKDASVPKFMKDEDTWVTVSSKLSPRQTAEVVISGKCETGERNTTKPRFGFLIENGEKKSLSPIPEPPDWDYDLFEDGKTVKHHNGLYDRKSVYYDEATATTRVILAVPPDLFKTEERVGRFGLEIRCDGHTNIYPIQVPLHAGFPADEYAEHVAPCETPPYVQWDSDGKRKGLMVLGPNTRQASTVVGFLELDSGYQCVKTEGETDLPEAILSLTEQQGEDTLDYLIRDTHSNGFDHRGGLIAIHKKGVKYTCTKLFRRKDGKEIPHEIVVLGPEGNAGEQTSVGYDDFIAALKRAKRKFPLLLANLSCSNVRQSCHVLVNAKSVPVQFISTVRSCSYKSGQVDANSDSGIALLTALDRTETYATMVDKYAVFSHEGILLPNHPDYRKEHLENIGQELSGATVSLNSDVRSQSMDERTARWISTGGVTRQDQSLLGAQGMAYYLQEVLEDNRALPQPIRSSLESRLAEFRKLTGMSDNNFAALIQNPQLLSQYLASEASAGSARDAVIAVWKAHGVEAISPDDLRPQLERYGNGFALYLLGQMGAEGRHVLFDTLLSSDGGTRMEAAEVLLPWLASHPRELLRLIPMLLDPSSHDSYRVLRLAEKHPKLYHALLKEMLSSEKPDVTWRALSRIFDPFSDTRQATIDPELVPVLETVARNSDHPYLADVLGALLLDPTHAKAAKDRLVRLLDDPNHREFRSAIRALASRNLDPEIVVPKLIQMFKTAIHHNDEDRSSAGKDLFRAIGIYAANGDKTALDLIKGWLANPKQFSSWPERWQGNLSHLFDGVGSELSELVDPIVSAALSQKGDLGKILIRALGDLGPNGRLGLGKIIERESSNPKSSLLLEALQELGYSRFRELSDNTELREPLSKLLRSVPPNSETAEFAAKSLLFSKEISEETLERLRPILENGTKEGKFAAAGIFIKHSDPESEIAKASYEVLRRELVLPRDNPSYQYSYFLVDSILPELGEKALPLMDSLFNVKSTPYQMMEHRTLAALGAVVAPALKKRLSDSSSAGEKQIALETLLRAPELGRDLLPIVEKLIASSTDRALLESAIATSIRVRSYLATPKTVPK